MESGLVYGLYCECGECPGAVRYVGLTTQRISIRLTNHRSMSRYGIQTPVYHWMRKHGEANIRIGELARPNPGETLDECEIRMIASTPNLLNLSPGGEGGWARGKLRPEHSEKMRGEGHYAVKMSEEIVMSIRREHTGKYGELTKFAKRYGVSVKTIESAIKGKSWKHLPIR